VYSIERQKELFALSKKFLPKVGYVPKKLEFGDGYLGMPSAAPFDGVIVTAGAPYVPKPLLSQLKIGGKLVIPVGEDAQVMTLIIRKGETKFEKHELGDFRFVPMLKEKE
ncbi:MAG: protein-L-isoaspartate O-methyltransferase, partial [Flavobacteriaceae bacterium]|nr:protein-L-isoaspartate O-methyltransferase [Flavobacteriaceae bacterium]